MRKVLLSGAGGYIGTVMVKVLLNTGHEVIALDRYFFGEDKIHNLKCNKLTILKDDIRYFDETLLKDVDIVIDLAGLSNDATAEINPVFTKEINCDGSIRLAELAKRYNVTQCIYSSSASVYGAGGKKALQETDKLNPLTDYSKSKVIVEDRLKELQDDKFHITLLRNSTVYGLSPRMRFDLAVNIMTYRAWKEGIIYVMGDGLQWRPFVHVRDVVKAFLLAIDNKKAYGETFNVGSNEQNYTLKDLAATISRYTKDTKVTFIPNSPDHRTYNVNFDKISNVLGFKPSFTIKDGVLEIEQALIDGTLVDNDPTHHTLKWYQTLIKYNKIIEGVKKYDRIL
jgi:nucleoside-diphosphate-sugar epimerase